MIQLYVSRLRPLLDGGGARIVTHGRGYELQLDDGDVDAVRLRAAARASRPREALALWSGDTLADVADEPFAAAEIRRIEELRLRATRDGDRRRPGGGPARGGDRRARGAGGRRIPCGAPARAAHARALSRRPPVRGAGGVPRRASRARRRDRRRARHRAAAAARRRSLPRTRRSTSPRRPVAAPPSVSAARARSARPRRRVDARSRSPACTALRRDPRPRARRAPGHRREPRGAHRPRSGRITAQYAVGESPDAVVAGGGSVWIANAAGRDRDADRPRPSARS